MGIILGYLDSNDQSWEGMFETEDLNQLRPIHLAQAFVNKISKEDINTFFENMTTVAQILRNDLLYQLLLLITILDTEGLIDKNPRYEEIQKLRQAYLKLLQRKLYAAQCTTLEYHQFEMILQVVKIIATFLTSLLGQK